MKLADTWEVEAVRDGLIAAVRAALKRSDIDGGVVTRLGGFLQAVERLPECDGLAGLSVIRGCMEREAVITSDDLRLSENQSHEFGSGTDHETSNILTLTSHGAEHDDEFTLWLRDFATMAGDAGCVVDAWCDE